VRSILELRSPSNGTGWGDTWTFSGTDDRLFRDCLDGLAEHATEPPIERRTRQKTSHVATKSDRWRAALLFSDDDKALRVGINAAPRAEARAWTSDGALQLAEVLPEQLGDLRDAIIERFAQT
jgi:hypothetical protein